MSRYGELVPPFTEDMRPEPLTPYGIAKYAADLQVRAIAGVLGPRAGRLDVPVYFFVGADDFRKDAALRQVIDAAVQLHGGLGVVNGVTVERLYREIRALRIYEGASEVLQLIVGVKHLEAARAANS